MCGPYSKADTAFVIARERQQEKTLSTLYGIKVSVNVGGFSQTHSACPWTEHCMLSDTSNEFPFLLCLGDSPLWKSGVNEALYLMYRMGVLLKCG